MNLYNLYSNCPYENEIKQFYKIMEEVEEFKNERINYKYVYHYDKNLMGGELIDCIQACWTYLINNFTKEQIKDLFERHLAKMEDRYS